MPEETEVLVVGAGPVGLATACALRTQGVQCRVIDASAEATPMNESRALAVWARTLEVLEDVGCVDRVLEKGLRTHSVNAYHGRKRLFRLNLDLEKAETPYPFVLVLPQGHTERILIERLAELGTHVERGVRVTSLETAAQLVNAVVVDADGGERSIIAKWLIGCDGAHSAVRHAMGFEFEGSPYPETFRLMDGKVDWDLDHNEVHMFLLSGGGGMAVFPLPGEGRWRLVDVSHEVVGKEAERVTERFRSLVAAEVPGKATMGALSWVSSFRIQRRISNHFRSGRCFVAGDAAHIHSPAGGQGMNTGIQDGHNLAWKLAMVIQGRAREGLLDSYESERRPVGLEVLKRTDLITQAVMMKSRVGRFIRNAMVPFLMGFSFVQKMIAREQSELEIDYGKSPIVREDTGTNTVSPRRFKAGPRAGRRCPDVLLGSNVDGEDMCLFAFLEVTKHTLLLFAGGGTPGQEFADVYRVIHEEFGGSIEVCLVMMEPEVEGVVHEPWRMIADPQGRLHERFGAERLSIYLIRPDGYVGYRRANLDVEALRTYLRDVCEMVG